jgi:hypothetical protein
MCACATAYVHVGAERAGGGLRGRGYSCPGNHEGGHIEDEYMTAYTLRVAPMVAGDSFAFHQQQNTQKYTEILLKAQNLPAVLF